MEYQVHLKIKAEVTPGGNYEFWWEDSEMRFDQRELDLIIEGDNESQVFDRVSELSKDTLEIISIFVPKQETLDSVNEAKEVTPEMQMYMELCMPNNNKDIIALSASNPIGIGNN